MCVYIYVNIHVYVYLYVCVSKYIHTRIYTYIYVCTCMCTCVHINKHRYMYICIHICVCVHTHTCACIKLYANPWGVVHDRLQQGHSRSQTVLSSPTASSPNQNKQMGNQHNPSTSRFKFNCFGAHCYCHHLIVESHVFGVY